MTRGARRRAVDGAAGVLRPAGDDRAAVQRVPAALRRAPARRWPHVVVEARKNGARIPWSYWHDKPLTADDYLAAPRDLRPDLHVRLRHPGRRRGDVRVHLRGAGTRPAAPTRCYVRRLRHGHARPAAPPAALAARRHHGRRRRDDPPALGALGCRARRRRPAAGLRRLLAVRLVLARGARLLPGRARRTGSWPDGGIDSDAPGALPALSGGGALGNGRMHGVPQMLECYLQLARRAGERQRAAADVGLACHSSPHYGGAVAYSREPALKAGPTSSITRLRRSASMSDLVASRSPYVDGTFVAGDAGRSRYRSRDRVPRPPRWRPRRWRRSTPRDRRAARRSFDDGPWAATDHRGGGGHAPLRGRLARARTCCSRR